MSFLSPIGLKSSQSIQFGRRAQTNSINFSSTQDEFSSELTRLKEIKAQIPEHAFYETLNERLHALHEQIVQTQDRSQKLSLLKQAYQLEAEFLPETPENSSTTWEHARTTLADLRNLFPDNLRLVELYQDLNGVVTLYCYDGREIRDEQDVLPPEEFIRGYKDSKSFIMGLSLT